MFRTSTNQKGRTVAYGIWHSTGIEDITMNLLVNGDNQVFHTENWKEKINASIVDTGKTDISLLSKIENPRPYYFTGWQAL